MSALEDSDSTLQKYYYLDNKKHYLTLMIRVR